MYKYIIPGYNGLAVATTVIILRFHQISNHKHQTSKHREKLRYKRQFLEHIQALIEIWLQHHVHHQEDEDGEKTPRKLCRFSLVQCCQCYCKNQLAQHLDKLREREKAREREIAHGERKRKIVLVRVHAGACTCVRTRASAHVCAGVGGNMRTTERANAPKKRGSAFQIITSTLNIGHMSRLKIRYRSTNCTVKCSVNIQMHIYTMHKTM